MEATDEMEAGALKLPPVLHRSSKGSNVHSASASSLVAGPRLQTTIIGGDLRRRQRYDPSKGEEKLPAGFQGRTTSVGWQKQPLWSGVLPQDAIVRPNDAPRRY